MRVNKKNPFKLVFSIFQHEYLGFLMKSFVVQLNIKGELSFTHQNLSLKNIETFKDHLSEVDIEMVDKVDKIQLDSLATRFQEKKRYSRNQFFLKVFDKKNPDKALSEAIINYVDKSVSEILNLIDNQRIFEMGEDGEPIWKELKVAKEKARILFHFRKNEDSTHYFPTIKLGEQHIKITGNESYIVSNAPAWIVSGGILFTFRQEVDGKKLKPFLKKKFVKIPKNMERDYYEKFVTALIAKHDVFAVGFEIVPLRDSLKVEIKLSKYLPPKETTGMRMTKKPEESIPYYLFEVFFCYGRFKVEASNDDPVFVQLVSTKEKYLFYRIKRKVGQEQAFLRSIYFNDIFNENIHKKVLNSTELYEWTESHQTLLEEINLIQEEMQHPLFLGASDIQITIDESPDWFDLKATVRFGDQEIPFSVIRKNLIKGVQEILLPNGMLAFIPDSWIEKYQALCKFSYEGDQQTRVKKMYFSLINSLEKRGALLSNISNNLKTLFENTQKTIYKTPSGFNGTLRFYQTEGYTWMRTLAEYNLGGCLADDMGLGKTIQTLAVLQSQTAVTPTLLITPTSLVYNWESEIKIFTPDIKYIKYIGGQREQYLNDFHQYQLIITSYGTIRQDIDKLSAFKFLYVILDESQAIKNPSSLTTQAVNKLQAQHKLVLTGTPIENSTMDLWSQMNFLNPGLLGSQQFFQKHFVYPIEKKSDDHKKKKLQSLIRPFMLRRDKQEVAKELPQKVVIVRYCEMTPKQREVYESEKNAYKAQILEFIETPSSQKSFALILQGLNKLRQISNHPSMVNDDYMGDSGKLKEFEFALEQSLAAGHKILVFSQFVKHLKIISELLDDKGISYSYLDGATKDRMSQVNRFQSDAHVPVFLISMKAGGTGLNLTKADYVFVLDPWWNPSVETQAIDRAHRIGQKKKVFAYKFITKDSIEEKILALQESKKQLASDLIHTGNSFLKALSKDELWKLFD